MKTEKKFKRLMCKLTEAEKIEMGDKLAAAIKEIISLESQKKKASEFFGDSIKAQRLTTNECANTITAGEIERSVEVIEKEDYPGSVVRVVRTDTGEVVEFRAMTEAEKQMDLVGIASEDDERKPKGSPKLATVG